MLTLALLATALLFGGMTLYSFGFAAFLFTALPPETAGAALRRAFPLVCADHAGPYRPRRLCAGAVRSDRRDLSRPH